MAGNSEVIITLGSGSKVDVEVGGHLIHTDQPTAGVRLRQRLNYDATARALQSIDIDVEVPPSFPEKYRAALVHAVDTCAVKRAIQAQPSFTTKVVAADR